MERPNFYILLGLDPSVSDRARIAEAIEFNKKEWSKQDGNPLTGKNAKKNREMLPQIERVMLNDDSRRQEAEQARRVIEATKREAAEELDCTIRVLAAKGYLFEKELKDLVNRHKKTFTEEEIRSRVRVPIRSNVQTKRPRKPVMEKSKFNDITSCLGRLKKRDLYELLGIPDAKKAKNISSSMLLEEAIKLDSEVRNEKLSTEKTDRSIACGYCMDLFKTEVGRELYDNALAMQDLHSLNPILSTAGLTQEGFTTEVVCQFLAEACEKGVDREEAIAYIIEFATTKKLPIPSLQQSASERFQKCGNCGVLNPERDSICGHCGKPLQITCPKCKTTNRSERRACSKCGFTVGDYFFIGRWLDDAELAIRHEDYEGALPLLQKVEALWPGEKRAATLFGKVAERKRRIDNLHQALLKLSNSRRYEEAERELATLRLLSPNHPDISRLVNEIETARSAARQHVSTGQQLERSGDADGALDAYQRALASCADCADAKTGLSRCPPSAPAFLYAAVDSTGVNLRWAATGSRGVVKYRVQRKIASAPRTSSDGATICDTAANSWVDATANSGELYYYSVFTDRAGVCSPSGAQAGPVLRVSEVSSIHKLERDRCIELTWTLPNGSTGAEVWRKPDLAPSRRGDGERVAVAGFKSVVDGAVLNGRIYGYRICAIFADAGGHHVFSDGVTVTGTPVEIPKPVVDLIAVVTGDGFEATWSLPLTGKVWIYHNSQRPTHKPGSLVSTTDLPSLGSRVQSLSPGHVTAPLNGDRSQYKYIIPVTVNGNTAVIGKAATLTWIGDVTDLDIVQDGDKLALTWRWPPGIEAARVVWCRDHFASGPHDLSAVGREDITHYQYHLRGKVQIARPDLPRLYVTVFAKVHDAEGWSFAAGAHPARKIVPLEMCVCLKYSVSTGLVFRSEATLSVTPSRSMCLPALALVARSGAMPTNIKDGVKVLDIPDGQSCSPEMPLTMTFSTNRLPPRWKVALFPVDAELGRWIDLTQDL